MDKLRPVTMSLLIYSGMLASLLALGTVSSFNSMLLAGFVAGLFATGGQSVLYALAPLFYSSQIRATGVGTAVAVGRLGAMSGPLLAGKMLALGTGTVGVMKTGCATTACVICARNGNRDAAAVVVLFFHSAGGLHVDQLAAAAFGGARFPASAGGRGDVSTANGGGKRDVNVGRIDG